MTTPRPYHQPHRDLRTTADASEPLCSSYDDSPHSLTEEKILKGLEKSPRESYGSHGGGSCRRSLQKGGNERPSSSGARNRSGANKGRSLLHQELQSNLTSANDRETQTLGSESGRGALRQRDANHGHCKNGSARDFKKKEKKDVDKRRALERDRKHVAQSGEVDIPYIDEGLQAADSESWSDERLRTRLLYLLDQCEEVCFPFKKKLMLNNMALTASDIPLDYMCDTTLGNTLHKLSLAGNKLLSVPPDLVQSLPMLKHLDLSQCELHQLPNHWNLPQLKRLNLSHNRLQYFPEEGMLKGLPNLQELNMYGNKVAEIIIPHDPTLLSKLEVLNLGYNDLYYLPDDLDQLKALKTLKVMNNLLEKVPMRICDMDLRAIDVSYNPVVQPPIETCERGICSMKRYYHCLHMEEQSKQKAVDELPKKVQKQKRNRKKKKNMSKQTTVDSHNQVTVNDTLKVIFVGAGKTSVVRRLIEGKDAVVPTHDGRTVGVDIDEWDPKRDKRLEHIDSRIEFQDKELAKLCGDVNVKFSVWDFSGKHVYHAAHELFFSPRALYVLVWDMGADNRSTFKKKSPFADERGPFKLSYDSDDEKDRKCSAGEANRADRALERDIDEKVQIWIDCIQSSAPGAAILPIASFADYFANEGGEAEVQRRCHLLKQRLLTLEDERIKGVKKRLKEYDDQNRANDQAAIRLRKLQDERPKLIFGADDENSVVCVSATQYTGFDKLTQKIVSIASGREKGRKGYPIFHGHIGVRIPRMRLEVREAVRTMRDRFKVVEWGYFVDQLRDRGLTSVEDISDALHFLTNIGELSYFGGVMTSSGKETGTSFRDGHDLESHPNGGREYRQCDSDEKGLDDDDAILSMDNTDIACPGSEEGTLTTVEEFASSGLSQFVFLNPRWLVAAVACILRHDLDRAIKEAQRMNAAGRIRRLSRTYSFYDAQMNCPLVTADQASDLWKAEYVTKRAAELAQENSNSMAMTPFEFLQLLLIRFAVFVPIDLNIEKAFLGGKEYAHLTPLDNSTASVPAETPLEVDIELTLEEGNAFNSKAFFLPSLLGPGKPSEVWTYKNAESWKITLAHAVQFPDGVPPGLMERLTADVLNTIYDISSRKKVFCQDCLGNEVAAYEGQLIVKEIFCWRTAFFIKLGTFVVAANGEKTERTVEIFTYLADLDSDLFLGSHYMEAGTRQLITSARGQIGDEGRTIWKGGYLLVRKCVTRLMEAYGGLEYEAHAFCPKCLAKKAVSKVRSWELSQIRAAVKNLDDRLRCQDGHEVNTRLVSGPVDALPKPRLKCNWVEPDVAVQDLLGAVVLVGLWNGGTRRIEYVGSGFVVDHVDGLIVTAAHTLMDIWGDKKSRFGENYFGLRQGKAVIGVIPKEKDADGKDMAVFRYFAQIVAKDPNMDNGECQVDACVLRITTRMENDVGGNGSGCGDQPERFLLNNPVALKNEKLQALEITDECELEEQVRILGFNQGGEGLLGPGESLNRYVDFARGWVCQKSEWSEEARRMIVDSSLKPREEITVMCPTIGGHSGGPCVNQQGEVIGILSRADPADYQRCYISPTSEWKPLVKQAKRAF